MPFNRNGPCPCGSGKNFPECHGQPGQEPPDAYRVNRAIARVGEIGRFRSFFARQYAEFKERVIADIYNTQSQRVASQGKQITCRKGCIHCCKAYVFATLEEAECIVYYLYAHEDKLDDFLRNYRDAWSQNKVIQRGLPLRGRVLEKVQSGQNADKEQELLDKYLVRYFKQEMRCPFLAADDTCNIYPVRPYVCAGIVATTPAEHCAPGSDGADFCKVTIRQAVNMPYFLKKLDKEASGALPDIVHRLLERGYAALEELTGNQGLNQRAAAEPEIKDVLAALGASLPG
jgi:Fe-S-cluster containining protein